MKICPSCQAQLMDEITVCPRCGTVQPAAAQQPQQPVTPPPYCPPQGQYVPPQTYQPYVDPADHTAEFSAEDIADNKLFAMLPYLSSVLGIIIALLGAKDSPYVRFHVKQARKLLVAELLVVVLTALTFWLILPVIAGGVCLVILMVLDIVAFFQVCGNKAKEPAIGRSLKFLR